METQVNTVRMRATDVGAGPTLVFLHGFPLNRRAWQSQVDTFQTSWRVVAPDLRGFGDTEAPPGATAMSLYAEDLHELLVEAATGPVVLVAHSMGGYVALAFARAFPAMLRGLVFVGTRAGADSKEAAEARRTTATAVKAKGPGVVIDAMVNKMLSGGGKDQRIGEVRNLMQQSSTEGVIGALLGMADRPDQTALLPEIRIPVLVVAGSNDSVVLPALSQELAHGIPGAEFKMIPGAGHLVAFDRPEEFNRALGEWLLRLAPVPSVTRSQL